jgi:tetratricopeptide (TPR) repeat protein
MKVKLSVVFCMAVLTTAATAQSGPKAPPAAHGTAGALPTYQAFARQLEETNTIADPLQRCLHMPDPPGSHWHAQGVAAYCRYRNSVTLTPSEITRMVAAGNAAAVDKAFEGYLHAQMTDPAQEGLLDIAVLHATFRTSTPAMRKTIDAWKRQRPHSAFAVAASGIQYVAAAYDTRDSALICKATDPEWARHNVQAKLARHEFDQAQGMTPVVPSMYSDMFALGRFTHDSEYAIAAMEKGVALDPVNLSLRITSATMSASRWGFSEGWLDKIESDAADLAPAHPLLWVATSRARIEKITDGQLHGPPDGHYLGLADEVATSTALAELAAMARHAGKREEALILAMESLRFDDNNYSALYSLGQAGSRGPRDPWIIETLRRAARNHPDDPEILGVVGVWLHYMGEETDAPRLMDAVYASDSTDRWALRGIGNYYLYDAHRLDRAARIADRLVRLDDTIAEGYFMRANVQIAQESPARYKAIHAYLERFGNDPYEAENVMLMRRYLQAHPESTARAKG